MDLIRMDHAGADAHLDRILSPTIFSVRTSRRLFRGMVGLTETQSWQRTFRLIAAKSRWDITDLTLEQHMGAAFQLVMELLSNGDGGTARRLDPSGESSLGLAKRMRLDVMRNRISGAYDALRDLADQHFGLPGWNLGFWETSASHRPWRSAPVGGGNGTYDSGPGAS